MDRTVYRTTRSQETQGIGQSLAKILVNEPGLPRVVCLYGELGAGKTTFVQGFARELGVDQRVASPTFVILKRYTIPNTSGFLYHVDLYRVSDIHTIDELGIIEWMGDTASYMLIEWAEKIQEMLPPHRWDIRFLVGEDEKHHITITKTEV